MGRQPVRPRRLEEGPVDSLALRVTVPQGHETRFRVGGPRPVPRPPLAPGVTAAPLVEVVPPGRRPEGLPLADRPPAVPTTTPAASGPDSPATTPLEAWVSTLCGLLFLVLRGSLVQGGTLGLTHTRVVLDGRPRVT